jgi:hypothetical protein
VPDGEDAAGVAIDGAGGRNGSSAFDGLTRLGLAGAVGVRAAGGVACAAGARAGVVAAGAAGAAGAGVEFAFGCSGTTAALGCSVVAPGSGSLTAAFTSTFAV